jgi:REP element-mobilizing transposase RayT
MPRSKRQWISQECGAFHISSKVVGNKTWFTREEKEYFVYLMERLASGFFIRIHAFCIMDNHFHILATGLEQEAQKAPKEELIRRYKLMYGEESEPPVGRYDKSGNIIPDADGGIDRLRERLGSVSRFVQELKQTFSLWYNKRHNLKGYLWGDRFKGVIVYHGEAQLICGAYIDLNPIRSKMVRLPEDYRWSSLGMRVRSPVRAGKLLSPLTLVDALDRSVGEVYNLPFFRVTERLLGVDWYRQFVYVSGGIEREGKGHIPRETVEEVLACGGHFGIIGRLGYRIRNFTEGIAIGGYSSIAGLQKSANRRYIRPRSFLDEYWSYTTRVLRSGKESS